MVSVRKDRDGGEVGVEWGERQDRSQAISQE